jgi:ribonuclease J
MSFNEKNNSGRRSRQNRSFGGRRGTPNLNKTAAKASDKAFFVTKKEVRGTPAHKKFDPNLVKGNLAVPGLNPLLNTGPRIATNAAPTYPDGPVVRVIPLGGTNEVGMNMTALECGDDIVLIDTGMGFGGGEKFPGVDYLIPDTEYIEMNRHKIRGLIYTHGHLDHIGAAPYILPKLGSIPIFGMPLSLALLKNRLQEYEMEEKLLAKVVDLDKPLRLGVFSFDFFYLNHSIPDVIGLAIDTPMGRIVYCTDWKFDNTPYDGKLSDYGKLSKLGDGGVRLLLTDSLGILKPGYAMSEKDIAKTVNKIFDQSYGRVIFTTFSTSVARLQHVVDACARTGRKLAVNGRSMVNNFRTYFEMGYIRVPDNLIVDFKDISRLPDDKICLLTTGSQGEDMAALSRMARDEHPTIKLQGGDSVIFSSSQIPGNEDAIQDLVAKLSRKGVDVYKAKEFDLHVSGHACHEDLKLLIALTRPDYLQPIHGDHYMLKAVGKLGQSMGIPFDHNLIGENGRIVELRSSQVVLTEDVITDKYLLVEGTSVGTVSEVVLAERRKMATQGSIVLVLLINKKKQLVGGPEIISRGFVYMKSSGELFDKIKMHVKKEFGIYDVDPGSASYFSDLRSQVRDSVSKMIYKITEKEPMIIPVVVQV